MAEEKVLKETREDELERELAQSKTRINMLKYYAHQQIQSHRSIPGIPQTRLSKDIVSIWKTVIRRLTKK